MTWVSDPKPDSRAHSTTLARMTAAGLVASVVWYETGDLVDAETAREILWNHTGYPGFWKTDNPTQEIREGVLRFVRGEFTCWLCDEPVETANDLCGFHDWLWEEWRR